MPCEMYHTQRGESSQYKIIGSESSQYKIIVWNEWNPKHFYSLHIQVAPQYVHIIPVYRWAQTRIGEALEQGYMWYPTMGITQPHKLSPSSYTSQTFILVGWVAYHFLAYHCCHAASCSSSREAIQVSMISLDMVYKFAMLWEDHFSPSARGQSITQDIKTISLQKAKVLN